LSRPAPARFANPFAFSGPVEIIAHRGYSARAPENTMAAIETAIAAGADAIEFDLHVTADGVPVLFHDETLERTSDGSGPLRDVPYLELSRLDAGSWFGPHFSGEPIPRFVDALSRLSGRVGRVYPEVKHHGHRDDLDVMVEAVRAADLVQSTVFISMDWGALGQMRGSHLDVNVGYVVEHVDRAHAAIERAAGDARALVDFDARILLADPSLVELAHRRGVELAVWTVDDRVRAAQLYHLGVRRITTNRVSDLLAWKATL
jgi:glycerophosphoryl diester phosphodiesterase